MYVWVENPVNYIASGQGNHQRGGIKVKTSDKTGQRAHTKCKKTPHCQGKLFLQRYLKYDFYCSPCLCRFRISLTYLWVCVQPVSSSDCLYFLDHYTSF